MCGDGRVDLIQWRQLELETVVTQLDSLPQLIS
jgi:hypothetical protein